METNVTTATLNDTLKQIKMLRRAVNKDFTKAAKRMPEREVKYLVSMYYTCQEMRIAVAARLRMLGEESNELLGIFLNQFEEVEKDIQAALDVYTDNNGIGNRFRQVRGIGPVLTAGWLAHVNVHIAHNCAKVLSFGGYNPNMVWEKGQKRPYNAEFKLVLSKMGRAFVFLSNRNSFFGQKYKDYKTLIEGKNERGEFAERCKEILAKKRYKETTLAYQAYIKGRYPKAHIVASARLKATALCVGILHREHYFQTMGRFPVSPYAVAFPERVGSNGHNLIDLDEVLAWEKSAAASFGRPDVHSDENISDSIIPKPDVDKEVKDAEDDEDGEGIIE